MFRTMGVLLLALLLAGICFAEDPFPPVLKLFEDMRPGAFEPGAQSRVYPVLEKMVALKDVRAEQPLAEFLVQTITAEDGLFDRIKKLQREGAAAYERMQTIDKELKHLNIRLKAGAHEVAPLIEARKSERERMERTFQEVRQDVDTYERSVRFTREVREKVVGACAEVLRSLKSEDATAGLTTLRRILDPKDRTQSLVLVRILRESGRRETAPHLIDLVNHPTAPEATRMQAVSALAALRDPEGIAVLLALWERDPEGAGVCVRHALSLAASRALADLDDARAWAKTLEQAKEEKRK